MACAIVAIFLFAASRTQSGRERVLAIFERIPSTRQAMYELALSRFTSALATYIAAGITTETAMRQALETVRHGRLRARLEYALEAMEDLENPRSLPQAFTEADILDPLYAHMLTAGAHAGSVDDVLADLSVMLFDDSTAQLDRALDRIEPLLVIRQQILIESLFQFLLLEQGVHRQIHLSAMDMCIVDGTQQFFLIKIIRICAGSKMAAAQIYRVRPRPYDRLKRLV